MSENERTFIRQLKITLISILGPFMLLTVGNMVNDHFKIKNNKEHVDVLEQNMVSREVLLIYVDEQKQNVDQLRIDLDKQNINEQRELAKINSRLDRIMKDIYSINSRDEVENKKPQS